MERPRKFVFIAHYVESWNWLLNFKIFSFLHKRPQLRHFLLPLYPICWIVSLYYLLGDKPFQVVDTYTVKDGLVGQTILIRNFAWHFMLPSKHELIRQRILAATLYAQDELQVDVVGLGALTKWEALTQGGQWLVKQSGVKLPVIHGDTCTASIVDGQVKEVCEELMTDGPIGVTGATSKIGSALIQSLIKEGYQVMALTRSEERFEALREKVPYELSGNLIHVTDVAEMKECRVWVTGKAKPSGKVLRRYIPKGAVVLNFAVPDPLSRWDLFLLRGVTHIEGGLAQTPPTCQMAFTMRLTHGITYACAAGTMIHTERRWSHSEVGKVVLTEMERMPRACAEIGITLPRRKQLR